MSGTIEISPQTRWSAAGWLFDWTVGYLASHVADPEVAAGLREIASDNLGWLGLDDYGPAARADLASIITGQLVPAADSTLPQTIANRPAVIDLLRALADQTASAPESSS
jgi:hypothetical protein